MVLFMELNIQIDSLFPSLELGGKGKATATTPSPPPHHPQGEKLSRNPAKAFCPPCKLPPVPCNARGGASRSSQPHPFCSSETQKPAIRKMRQNKPELSSCHSALSAAGSPGLCFAVLHREAYLWGISEQLSSSY